MKHLIMKVGWSKIKIALSEWRNMPRADGFSPSQMFFGRRQRGQLPCLGSLFESINENDAIEKWKTSLEKSINDQNKDTKELTPLKVNDIVLVQNPKSKLWTHKARIIGIRKNKRSYDIQFLHTEKITIRNRRYLRLSADSNEEESEIEVEPSNLRRSVRLQERESAKSQKKVTFKN